MALPCYLDDGIMATDGILQTMRPLYEARRSDRVCGSRGASSEPWMMSKGGSGDQALQQRGVFRRPLEHVECTAFPVHRLSSTEHVSSSSRTSKARHDKADMGERVRTAPFVEAKVPPRHQLNQQGRAWYAASSCVICAVPRLLFDRVLILGHSAHTSGQV